MESDPFDEATVLTVAEMLGSMTAFGAVDLEMMLLRFTEGDES